jgi:hypothetical protein
MYRIGEVTAAAEAREELLLAASQVEAALGEIEAYVKRQDFCGYDHTTR